MWVSIRVSAGDAACVSSIRRHHAKVQKTNCEKIIARKAGSRLLVASILQIGTNAVLYGTPSYPISLGQTGFRCPAGI